MNSSKLKELLPPPADGAVAPIPVGEPYDGATMGEGFVEEVQGFSQAVKTMNLKLTDGRARMVGVGGRACHGKTDAPLRE